MEAKHTATPWKLRNDGQTYNGQTIEAECMGNGHYAGIAHATQRDPHPTLGGGIDQVTAEANASFIVRACNTHDALVKALRQIARLSSEGEVSANMQYALGDIALAALSAAGA
ncbi:MAG TPA: hypothetical protein VJ654_14240 [Noviherbaspirillum sp.]|nr:hypothetical protein [Noviherbaspirillum sp.]